MSDSVLSTLFLRLGSSPPVLDLSWFARAALVTARPPGCIMSEQLRRLPFADRGAVGGLGYEALHWNCGERDVYNRRWYHVAGTWSAHRADNRKRRAMRQHRSLYQRR